MIELSISIRRQYISLLYTLVYILVGCGFIYYKYYSLGYFNPLFFVGLIPLIILIIPAVALHLQYYIEDRSKTVLLDNEREIMVIDNKKAIASLDYNKIISITKVARNVVGEFSIFYLFPWSSYFYYKIKYIDNEVYFITCLTTSELKITKIKNEIETSIFPLLSKRAIEIIYANPKDNPQ